MEISKTQQALQKMVSVIKASDGKIRHVDIENAVKADGEFSKGHISGAFNQLRSKGADYQIKHERIYGKSYFEYYGVEKTTEEDNEFRSQVIKKSNLFLDELRDMKKNIENVQDFQWLQDIIGEVQEIFEEK